MKGPCSKCNGSGQILGKCAMCNGKGTSNTGNTCQSCGGTGQFYKFCSTCNGTGEIDKPSDYWTGDMESK